MAPAMSIPEVIPAEVSGYCDLETGACVTAGPVTSDDKTASGNPVASEGTVRGHGAVRGTASPGRPRGQNNLKIEVIRHPDDLHLEVMCRYCQLKH
jgi:hypothetical protein